MEDKDYQALCEIESGRAHEISVFSPASDDFLDYVLKMRKGRLYPNGTLKALSLFDDLFELPPAATESLRLWSDAIIEASLDPNRRVLFTRIRFDEPVREEFLAADLRADRLLKAENRDGWLFLLGDALVCAALLAVLVLLLKMNFFVGLVILLLVFGLGILWYDRWLRYSFASRRLSQSLLELDGPALEFARSIGLRSFAPFHPKWRKILFGRKRRKK